jgi:isopenicillin-N epimerase
MKEHYLLDPEIIFLNHGSFGATPRPVLEAYQNWQVRLERQPVQFLGREIWDELKQARQILGNYLTADADNLVYIPNATFGVNIIARSLQFEPGDEILTTDHEYGACENVWIFVGQKNSTILVKRSIPLPMRSPTEVAEQFWQGVTPKTKVIFISHITSPTAVRMPVDLICKKSPRSGYLDRHRRCACPWSDSSGFDGHGTRLLPGKLSQMDAKFQGSRISIHSSRITATFGPLGGQLGLG